MYPIQVLELQMSPALIDLLDHDGSESIDELEYVIGILIASGAEICGEPIEYVRFLSMARPL